METENKYKTFGELKVGDKIIAVDDTTNNKYVYEVYGTEKNIDFIDAECVALNIIKINPIDERSNMSSITFCADDYVATYNYKTFISDADNEDEIFADVKKHGSWVKDAMGRYMNINFIGDNVITYDGDQILSYEDAYSHLVWADDGSVFGMLEEE